MFCFIMQALSFRTDTVMCYDVLMYEIHLRPRGSSGIVVELLS